MLHGLITLGFLSFCLGAGWLFYARPVTTLQEKLKEQTTSHPLVILEDFIIFKQEQARVMAQSSGDYGAFYAPDRIEVHGHVNAWRVRAGHTEMLAAQQAHAWLLSMPSISSPVPAQLDRIELEKQVLLSLGSYQVLTEQAVYTTKTQQITGALPVKIAGKGHWITGNRGFSADLQTEEVHVFGHVEGAAQLETH